MYLNEKNDVRIAILDLYEGLENQGMRCLRQIIKEWADVNQLSVVCDEFEIRLKQEIPDLSYDIYISSGGPGSPLESEGLDWENKYFDWISTVVAWNNNPINNEKKNIFFICHSFQLACRYFKIGKVCKRISTAFGVFPIHVIKNKNQELTFEGLKDPFYAVDSRDYQVVEPDITHINEIGAAILAIEKDRPHVPYERAIMSVRFSDYLIGTQFHPEADASGMLMYLQREDKMKTVIENHGEVKWKTMIEQLGHPDKIKSTYSHVLPNFLNNAVGVMIEN